MPDNVYKDKTGVYPKREYNNAPTTNLEARGIEENHLAIGGGDVDLDLELKPLPSSQYPLNQVRRSVTGHVTEIDDTPGRERMLFKHRTGAGVEMRPDGTVIINSTNNQITIAGGDQKVIIEGNGQMVYHGNLNMRVDGDFDLDVGGNMNVTVGQAYEEDIKGGFRQDVNGPHASYINGNVTSFITKNQNNMIIGDQNNQIKGDVDTNIEGVHDHGVKGQMHVSSETRINNTSPDINIAGDDITVIGDDGTFGGQNIVYYGHTAHVPRVNSTSMHATTFHGDLQGTANQAITADVTNSQNYSAASTGSANGYTAANTSATNKTTVQPTSALMTGSWFVGSYGIFKVAIDAGNAIYNKLNRLFDYNNISDRQLTTREVRSKLRDPETQKNEKFVGSCIADGILSSSYTVSLPLKIGDIVGKDATPRSPNPNEVFGIQPGAEQQRYKATIQNVPHTLRPADKFNPVLAEYIDRDTKLSRGITIAKFLGSYGDQSNFDDVETADRIDIAKHLYLQTPLIKSVMNDIGEFAEYRLVVAEGFYTKGANETITPGSLNDLATKGRVCVYELYDREGKQARKATFRLAAWWKDSQRFDKMILDYDSYNPNGEMNVQIIVVMPELDEGTYTASYNNTIETRLNNYVQSTNELVEILEI